MNLLFEMFFFIHFEAMKYTNYVTSSILTYLYDTSKAYAFIDVIEFDVEDTLSSSSKSDRFKSNNLIFTISHF